MAELKTKPNDASVEAFLDAVPDERKRSDSYTILELMKRVTGEEPKLWGGSIVGFGSYHYTYASGHSGDAPISGFSPRKQNLALYIMAGFASSSTTSYWHGWASTAPASRVCISSGSTTSTWRCWKS
jgi:hypothetical protein